MGLKFSAAPLSAGCLARRRLGWRTAAAAAVRRQNMVRGEINLIGSPHLSWAARPAAAQPVAANNDEAAVNIRH